MLKLNLGCGLKYKRDYINIDSSDSTVSDEIMKAYELIYDDESVDLIESFQLVENLGFNNTILALGEWFRVLKTNSSVIIETSDIEKTFELYLKTTDHNQKATTLNWIYDLNHKHKYCYPSGLLRRLLVESGFVEIMENHHEKTFGTPTYTLIAKKPLNYNPNYLLIHNLRKRVYSNIELFKTVSGPQYQLDFEKTVLGYNVGFTPRDFSTITFNELFTKCLSYSLTAAKILIEESAKLNIISEDQQNQINEKINLLESLSFHKCLYSIWHKNFIEFNNPDKAYILSTEIAGNIAKQALFDASIDNFKAYAESELQQDSSIIIFSEDIYSYQLIENMLSRILAKYIKGIASDEEIVLCKALTISN